MQPSTPDTVALGQAVEQRFLDLCSVYLRVNGAQLQIPVSLKSDAVRWRAMVLRHRSGDFRNTEQELKSTRAVAQWTVNENCRLRNQPVKIIQWSS